MVKVRLPFKWHSSGSDSNDFVPPPPPPPVEQVLIETRSSRLSSRGRRGILSYPGKRQQQPLA